MLIAAAVLVIGGSGNFRKDRLFTVYVAGDDSGGNTVALSGGVRNKIRSTITGNKLSGNNNIRREPAENSGERIASKKEKEGKPAEIADGEVNYYYGTSSMDVLPVSLIYGASSTNNAHDGFAGSGPYFAGHGAATQSGGSVDHSAIAAIRAAIERNLTYPYRAVRRKIEGTVMAEFSISRKGLPVNVRVSRSSGHDILDSAAEETIIKAAPFPPIEGEIEVPVTFRLKNRN